ncbi:regulatory protein RecX [Saccharopolyspora rhizosphaerae]|uniref:Regulatory protein RecX n=1 Tax=Saccharopolyspora rhizosphaerae TaxID=2492662 RepID=A0A426JP55_9PSEU|nr:regulatory protein RecX [Saccharopolyspora rhizosphaerae]RRO14865.1 regulatory protein RecX [Saccharopolyspora rhizosphaerae]
MDDEAERRGSGRRTPGAGPEGGEAGEKKSRRKPDDPAAQARDVVYRLLASRARSRLELRQALLRKDIDEDVADGVLQKFVDAGLVDDAAFAEEWVNQRQRSQGLGRKALGFELRRKGIEEHLVESALSNVDSDAEAERARELVQRKLRSMGSVEHTAKVRRLVGMLARKGYSEGLAYRIVKEEIENAGDSADGLDFF